MVYNQAGIYSGGKGSSYSSQCSNGQSIKSINDLKVGDIVHFFNNYANKDTATGSGWYHVAYIGEVYDDKVVGYDGGSYFTNNRNFKWEAKKMVLQCMEQINGLLVELLI